MNKFDWALTMRTYLLGNEEYLRSTANFHSEYYRRGHDAYTTANIRVTGSVAPEAPGDDDRGGD